jgi:hypothetical protein
VATTALVQQRKMVKVITFICVHMYHWDFFLILVNKGDKYLIQLLGSEHKFIAEICVKEFWETAPI